MVREEPGHAAVDAPRPGRTSASPGSSAAAAVLGDLGPASPYREPVDQLTIPRLRPARHRSGSRRSTGRPSRSRPGSGPGRRPPVAGREVRDLLLGDGQRQPPVEVRQELVRPGVGGEDDRRAAVRDTRRRRPRNRHRPPGSRRRAACSSSVAPRACASRRWAAFPRYGSAMPPWRLPHRRSRRRSSRHCGQRRMISAARAARTARPRRSGCRCPLVRLRDGRVGGPQVEAAGHRHDPLAGLGLDLGPRLVRPLGEPDVVGRW